MTRQSLLALFLLATAASGARADNTLDDGKAAWNKGDFATAMTVLAPMAEQGNPSAEYYVGIMYGSGQGRPEDGQKSIMWLEKAAGHGSIDARYALCQEYSVGGVGVPPDLAKAYVWCELAGTGYVAAKDEEAEGTVTALRDLAGGKLTPAALADAKKQAEAWLAQH
jgi:TPR repeat protein